jgi:hypothetical protein
MLSQDLGLRRLSISLFGSDSDQQTQINPDLEPPVFRVKSPFQATDESY